MGAYLIRLAGTPQRIATLPKKWLTL